MRRVNTIYSTHMVASLDQISHQMVSDKSACTQDQNFFHEPPMFIPMPSPIYVIPGRDFGSNVLQQSITVWTLRSLDEIAKRKSLASARGWVRIRILTDFKN